MARDRSRRKITIEIDNLTEAQEIALNDLFATWQGLGGIGSSRWTAFFADGDGDFRPKIKINGLDPKLTDLLEKRQELCWGRDNDIAIAYARGGSYKIDYDWIGWALQAKEDANGGTDARPSS